MAERTTYRFLIYIEDEGDSRVEELTVTCANNAEAISAAKMFAENCAFVSVWRGDYLLWKSLEM